MLLYTDHPYSNIAPPTDRILIFFSIETHCYLSGFLPGTITSNKTGFHPFHVYTWCTISQYYIYCILYTTLLNYVHYIRHYIQYITDGWTNIPTVSVFCTLCSLPDITTDRLLKKTKNKKTAPSLSQVGVAGWSPEKNCSASCRDKLVCMCLQKTRLLWKNNVFKKSRAMVMIGLIDRRTVQSYACNVNLHKHCECEVKDCNCKWV